MTIKSMFSIVSGLLLLIFALPVSVLASPTAQSDPNNAPVAIDDSATTDEDTPVTIDILSNDNDVDGDTLAVDSVSQPANASVSTSPAAR